jgi:FKBP-type peptidyl-prolyl cis-trans isomerase 2
MLPNRWSLVLEHEEEERKRNMPQAKQGDTVRVHYTGKLDDDTVFDSSRERDPLELTLGAGQVISGFESAIEGMAPGESKNVHIPVADAYGQRQAEKILEFDRSALGTAAEPQVGERVQLQTQEGHSVPAVIARVSESTVTVDANHPLAGRDLVFDLELVEIV